MENSIILQEYTVLNYWTQKGFPPNPTLKKVINSCSFYSTKMPIKWLAQ